MTAAISGRLLVDTCLSFSPPPPKPLLPIRRLGDTCCSRVGYNKYDLIIVLITCAVMIGLLFH